MLLLTIPMMGMSVGFAEDAEGKTEKQPLPTSFVPSPEPVFSTPRAKPNIHMVLDDSGSMKARDVPAYKNGPDILRTTALDNTVSALLRKYRDKAYLGVSFIWQGDNDYGLVDLPIGDYSQMKDNDFESKIISPISTKILRSPGNTPVSRGVYEAMKHFRGQPLNKATGGGTSTTTIGSGKNTHYQYTQKLETPLRYRCQQNHMVVMTDGQPNDNRIYGIAKEDTELYDLSHKVTNNAVAKIVDGVDMSRWYSYTSSLHLGEIAANLDLRKAYKPYITGYETDKKGRPTEIPIWGVKDLDDAGKPWDDAEYSAPMPIYMHTVSLYVKPDADVYTGLTQPTSKYKDKPGMNLGFAKGQGTAEDLLLAFDTIFSSIILSTSSTLSMNDRIHSDMLGTPPKISANGEIDLSSLGTIRYDTIYDFRQNFGSVRAMVPYISGKDTNGEPIITSYPLWSTDKSITPEQGRYVTLSNTKPSQTILELKVNQDKVLEQFKKIDKEFSVNYIDWLTNFKKTTDLNGLRGRLNPLGSITNSDITTVNKDILNISIARDKMSYDLRKDLGKWLAFKTKNQPKNLLIVGDNDGFISFINAQRGLTGKNKGGQRDTAYFPQMLVHRFKEIAGSTRVETLVMEGRTNLVDAKVYDATDNVGDLYATLGMTSMGGGGKGLVGYRIYAAKASEIGSGTLVDNVLRKVTPLFEITNEGPNTTAGFSDLGYTYSGFEFFNRLVADSNGKMTKGQAVAVFGNGFGTEKSVLYFVDAYTGEKLHEIVLNPNGKGASTPSIIVSQDANGQKIDRIYVGDYSGTLYKVDFNGNSDFTDEAATVTALFKAPATNFGQSAISVKPLVVKAKNSNMYRVFFGTGLAANLELDRGDNSLVTHAVYGINDFRTLTSKDNAANFATVSKLKQPLASALTPYLTVDKLKKGFVNYKQKDDEGNEINNKPNYEVLDSYDLSLHTPTDNENTSSTTGKQDGWYVILAADNEGIEGSGGAYNSAVGTVGAGERVIRNPQYDALNDAVVFSTWGIRERDSKLTAGKLDDPCISDLAFGKVLSFYAGTGGGSFAIDITNKGTTGTAQGVLTGDSVIAAPEGNGLSTLEDLAALDQDSVEEGDNLNIKNSVVGGMSKENSSYETDKSKSGVYCVSGIDGKAECVEIKRPDGPTGSDPIRLSIQTLFGS